MIDDVFEWLLRGMYQTRAGFVHCILYINEHKTFVWPTRHEIELWTFRTSGKRQKMRICRSPGKYNERRAVSRGVFLMDDSAGLMANNRAVIVRNDVPFRTMIRIMITRIIIPLIKLARWPGRQHRSSRICTCFDESRNENGNRRISEKTQPLRARARARETRIRRRERRCFSLVCKYVRKTIV